MSYSGDPSTSGLDAVRFWAQDTGTTGLLSDGEVEYLIAYSGLDPVGEPIEVAAIVADRIAAKYAGEVSINSDGVSYSGDQLQQKYGALAKELRQTHARISSMASYPFVGGLQRGRNFGVGMHDNPGGYDQTLNPSGDDRLAAAVDPLTGKVGG